MLYGMLAMFQEVATDVEAAKAWGSLLGAGIGIGLCVIGAGIGIGQIGNGMTTMSCVLRSRAVCQRPPIARVLARSVRAKG